MATCATLGQAVGTAMHYAISRQMTGRQIVNSQADMERVQQLLLRQDQAMLNVKNQDPDDLALQANVSASDEIKGFEANQVIDGINRDIQDGKSHQWRARVTSGQEPWIQLAWNSPITVGQIEFTFDTGLNRFLRFSGQKVVMADQIRGRQPETISDFKIEGLRNGKVVYSDFVMNNYYRKYCHKLDPISIDSLKITVTKTNGDEFARIFEIRCYKN